jgi:hypothetical protein
MCRIETTLPQILGGGPDIAPRQKGTTSLLRNPLELAYRQFELLTSIKTTTFLTPIACPNPYRFCHPFVPRGARDTHLPFGAFHFAQEFPAVLLNDV